MLEHLAEATAKGELKMFDGVYVAERLLKKPKGVSTSYYRISPDQDSNSQLKVYLKQHSKDGQLLLIPSAAYIDRFPTNSLGQFDLNDLLEYDPVYLVLDDHTSYDALRNKMINSGCNNKTIKSLPELLATEYKFFSYTQYVPAVYPPTVSSKYQKMVVEAD